jgi:hypothetical protein
VDVAPIFVIGTGRSGTTLLRLMLCAHPRIYITHEASFYMWEHMRRKTAPAAILDYFFQTPSFRWLRLDPAPIRAQLPAALVREDLPAAYAAVMRAKAAQYNRPRFGDKTPLHSAYLRHIFRDYPDAKVVHIVRDPRATALSLSKMPWSCASVWANAKFCDVESRQVERYKDRVLRIRLEDLLASPRDTMGKVLDYVGEPWDDAVLDHAKHAPDKADMPPLPWFESATAPRGGESKQWEKLPARDLRSIERAAKHVMASAGYAPANVAAEPGRLAVWWRGARDIPETVRYLFVYARIMRIVRDPAAFDSPPLEAAFRRINPGSWVHYPGFVLPVTPPLIAGALPDVT